MNSRFARELILQGDMLAQEGRLHDARERYVQSIEIVTSTPLSGRETVGDQAVSVALTRAIGHERVGLVRTWLGESDAAADSFADSVAALQEAVANVDYVAPDQATIIEDLRVDAPARWRQAQLLQTDPPTVDLAMATKICEHGCLSKSGLCRGHPPDPCW